MAKQIQINKFEINSLRNYCDSDEDENQQGQDECEPQTEEKQNTNKQDDLEQNKKESENLTTELDMTFMNPSECLKCGDCSFNAKI